MLYTSFVVLHILSAGVIVGLITIAIIGTQQRKKVTGTPAELASIRMAAITSPIMANIGSLGLLVSGFILTLMDFSFFPFGTLPWLALMQTDYLVIMAIAGAVLGPNGKRILATVEAELAAPGARNGASEELRAMVNKQYVVVLFVGFLVLIAVALGESKSLMWVTAH